MEQATIEEFRKELLSRLQELEESEKSTSEDHATVELDQATQVQACYEKALEENPTSLTARLAFGRWLYSQDRFTEAVEHLEWSAQQQPDNEKLQRWLAACRKSASGG